MSDKWPRDIDPSKVVFMTGGSTTPSPDAYDKRIVAVQQDGWDLPTAALLHDHGIGSDPAPRSVWRDRAEAAAMTAWYLGFNLVCLAGIFAAVLALGWLLTEAIGENNMNWFFGIAIIFLVAWIVVDHYRAVRRHQKEHH